MTLQLLASENALIPFLGAHHGVIPSLLACLSVGANSDRTDSGEQACKRLYSSIAEMSLSPHDLMLLIHDGILNRKL